MLSRLILLKRFVPPTAAALVLMAGLAPGAVLHAQGAPPAPERQHGRFAGMQRVGGEVTAIAGPTVTVKAEDGASWQIVTSDETRFMRRGGDAAAGAAPERGARFGQPSTLAALKVGDGVMAVGAGDDATHTLHAMFVISTDAATLAAMRANLGKTYITGRVVSVDLDNATMAVLRPDGVTQTIGFDESTSFRRGHGRRGGMSGEDAESAGQNAAPPADAGQDESITLADIHAGDMISGRGSLKNGAFVPAELTVMSRPPRPHGGPVYPPAGSANR